MCVDFARLLCEACGAWFLACITELAASLEKEGLREELHEVWFSFGFYVSLFARLCRARRLPVPRSMPSRATFIWAVALGIIPLRALQAGVLARCLLCSFVFCFDLAAYVCVRMRGCRMAFVSHLLVIPALAAACLSKPLDRVSSKTRF